MNKNPSHFEQKKNMTSTAQVGNTQMKDETKQTKIQS